MKVTFRGMWSAALTLWLVYTVLVNVIEWWGGKR